MDAFFLVAGYPVTAIDQLARNVEIDLLPIDGAAATTLLALKSVLLYSVLHCYHSGLITLLPGYLIRE